MGFVGKQIMLLAKVFEFEEGHKRKQKDQRDWRKEYIWHQAFKRSYLDLQEVLSDGQKKYGRSF